MSLPLELRQKILLLSFEEPYSHDRAFILSYALLQTCIEPTMQLRHLSQIDYLTVSAPHMYGWACTLRDTHPEIGSDLLWVLKKALDQFGANFVSEISTECRKEIYPGYEHTFRRWLEMVTLNNFTMSCYVVNRLNLTSVFDQAFDRKESLKAFMRERLR